MNAEGGGTPGKQTARKQTGQLITGRSAPKDSLEEFMAKNDADEDDSEGEVSNSHQYDDEDDDYDEEDDDDPAGPFTRDELESMDKEELISIILTHQDRIFGRQLYNNRGGSGPTSSSRHGNGTHDIDDEDDIDDEEDIDEEGLEEEDEGSEAVEKTSSSTSPVKGPSEAIAAGEASTGDNEGSVEASSSDAVSSTKRHKSE